MDFRIKNRRALVLGASMGLGKGVAKTLAQEGAKVAIVSRDEGRINKAAREIGAAAALVADLTLPNTGRKLIEQAEKALGGNIEILVTNAGGPPKGSFQDLTTEQWQAGFQSLWLAAVEAMQGVLPKMKENKWGRILLITSVAAREPMPGLNVSNGLRAGLLGLTRSVSNEVAPFGVTINALLPGYTDTERLKELAVPTDKMIAQIPAGRLGTTDELGALATFLSSDQAGYITGQAIAIDGGYLRGI